MSERHSVREFRNHLHDLYVQKLLPVEEKCKFHQFVSPKLDDSFFDLKPVVLLVGGYSTGKTSFIHTFLGTDFPGMKIGMEPTTDKFTVVAYNSVRTLETGNTVISDPTQRFSSLSQFGTAFLSHFQCSLLPNEKLRDVTFIDTPGVMSRRDHNFKRGYDFINVIKCLAELSDSIIIMVEPMSLDIADEFAKTLELFRKFPKKTKLIFNKIDGVEPHSLMRLFMTLLWNLGQALKTPEVPDIFLGYEGSQANQGLVPAGSSMAIFGIQAFDLLKEIETVSIDISLANDKLGHIAQRIHKAKILAHVLKGLKKEVPPWYHIQYVFLSKTAKSEKAMESLYMIYMRTINECQANVGDLPLEDIKQKLSAYDIKRDIPSMPNEVFQTLDALIEEDVPMLQLRLKEMGQQSELEEIVTNLEPNLNDIDSQLSDSDIPDVLNTLEQTGTRKEDRKRHVEDTHGTERVVSSPKVRKRSKRQR